MEEMSYVERAAELLKEDMLEFIEDYWEEYGGAEKGLCGSEAALYLGHSIKGMSQKEIDEEVSYIQLSYYTEGEADIEDISRKYVEMKEAEEEKRKKKRRRKIS